MKAEYLKGYLQRDSVERKEYVGVPSVEAREGRERDGARTLLDEILDRDNLNQAYKRVKSNKGAPGIDGMTVGAALPWLKEHGQELRRSIWDGEYKPSPVRRVMIPKPDGGGERKLGIPTVIDRVIQQAISQKLQPIFDPLFADESYGYRPGRSGQQAIQKVKEYVDQGYTQVAEIDLSKYFDTINHELLLNLLRQEVKDPKVISLIKKYLKSGVMENGIVVRTEEGSPQGGNLSPLLANIYLNQYDQEMKRRGVAFVRYADDIVVLAKSKRAEQRLLESSKRYLEGKLKLKVYMIGWLNYYHIASIKTTLMEWNSWLRRRFRMYIWKQWKKPRTKIQNLIKLGIPEWQAYQWGNSRLGYWRLAASPVLSRSITNKRIARSGYFDILERYEQLNK